MFGSCEKFLDHVKTNICAGDEIKYSRLMVWLGMLVQNPQHPIGTALVLKGKQGTGKSIFAKAIGALFAEHFLCISDSRHLVGCFNTHLKDNIVLFADEAFVIGDRRCEDMLKYLITDENICIERKGYDAEIVPNHTHVIMSVNTEWVAPKTIRDRRFLVLDVADNRQYDANYFGPIISELDSGGHVALSQYLMGL